MTGDCRKLHNEKNELISATFTKTISIVTKQKQSNNTPRYGSKLASFSRRFHLKKGAVCFWKVVCGIECFYDDVIKSTISDAEVSHLQPLLKIYM